MHHIARRASEIQPVDPFAEAQDLRRQAAECRLDAVQLAQRSQGRRDRAALLDRLADALEASAVPACVAELQELAAGMSSRNAEMIQTIAEMRA